jgi:lipoprotein-anchoring transpeptidase ErfK/SrfK
MQISLRPGSAQISSANRRLAAMAAGCALLCGATAGHAVPLAPPQPTAMSLQEIGRPGTPAQRPSQSLVPLPPAKPAAKEIDAKPTLGIIVSLEKQQLTLYADGEPIARSPVSSGKPGHETPAGVFSIIEKDRWHHSNLYDDAPMFFMQRLTSSGVALHQGIVPNHPASHGCVRLPEAFAQKLWGMTKPGVRVIIARGDVAPVDISHPRLFAPRREPLEAKAEPSSAVVQIPDVAFAMSRLRYATSDSTMIAGMSFGEPQPRLVANKSFAENLAAPAAALGAESPAGTAPAQKPLKPGPVSVFISRKEGRLFVRKGFAPVFDAPVTFDHPERSLGTHVFSAYAVASEANAVRWTVVSIPSATATSSAADALDRISIPQDAVERISDLMSPGASLIISDQGLGPETGVGTDFIVLTR